MNIYSFSEAVTATGIESRLFRTFVDTGMIQPTSDTRQFGRGAAKRFAQTELQIADVLNRLHFYGFVRAMLSEIALTLRDKLNSLKAPHTLAGDNYLMLTRDGSGNSPRWHAFIFKDQSEKLTLPADATAKGRGAEIFVLRLRTMPPKTEGG